MWIRGLPFASASPGTASGGHVARRPPDRGKTMFDLPNPLLVLIGIPIGILVAAPVGPVNILCIQRSIERGVWNGIAAGTGAVLADALIAFAAALGVGAITGALARYRLVIQMIGGLVLILAGARLLTARPNPIATSTEGGQSMDLAAICWDIPKSFLLTITNPGPVLGLIAIFGAVSTFVEVNTTVDAVVLVTAIAVGSLSWWIFLATLVSRFRSRFKVERIHQINRICGLLLLGFGAILIAEVAWIGRGIW